MLLLSVYVHKIIYIYIYIIMYKWTGSFHRMHMYYEGVAILEPITSTFATAKKKQLFQFLIMPDDSNLFAIGFFGIYTGAYVLIEGCILTCMGKEQWTRNHPSGVTVNLHQAWRLRWITQPIPLSDCARICMPHRYCALKRVHGFTERMIRIWLRRLHLDGNRLLPFALLCPSRVKGLHCPDGFRACRVFVNDIELVWPPEVICVLGLINIINVDMIIYPDQCGQINGNSHHLDHSEKLLVKGDEERCLHICATT